MAFQDYKFDGISEFAQAQVRQVDEQLKHLLVAIAPLIVAPSLDQIESDIVWLSDLEVQAVWAVKLSPLASFDWNAWSCKAQSMSSILLVEMGSLVQDSTRWNLSVSIAPPIEQRPYQTHLLASTNKIEAWVTPALAANVAYHIDVIQRFDYNLAELALVLT